MPCRLCLVGQVTTAATVTARMCLVSNRGGTARRSTGGCRSGRASESVGGLRALVGHAAGAEQAVADGLLQGVPGGGDDVLVDADRGPGLALGVARLDQHPGDR